MSDDSKGSVSFSFDVIGFWLALFILFWAQSGWYRVDCAIGIKPACELIASESTYIVKAPKP